MKNNTNIKNITNIQHSLSYALNIVSFEVSILYSAFYIWSFI